MTPSFAPARYADPAEPERHHALSPSSSARGVASAAAIARRTSSGGTGAISSSAPSLEGDSDTAEA